MEIYGYIYGLRLIGTDEIRYVGLTTATPDKRLRQHTSAALRGSSLPLHRWLVKHGSESVEAVVLEEGIASIKDLEDRECFWITSLQTFNTARGLNCTKGGRFGATWNSLSPEQQERSRERMRQLQKLQTATPEARAERSRLSSETITRQNADSEFTKRKSERMKSRWQDAEWASRQRILSSERMKERHTDPDFADRRDTRSREQWNDPSYREMMISSAKENWENPELRERMIQGISAAAKKQMEDPEKREALRLKGLKGVHVRFHTNRGIVKSDCPHCQIS